MGNTKVALACLQVQETEKLTPELVRVMSGQAAANDITHANKLIRSGLVADDNAANDLFSRLSNEGRPDKFDEAAMEAFLNTVASFSTQGRLVTL